MSIAVLIWHILELGDGSDVDRVTKKLFIIRIFTIIILEVNILINDDLRY